MSEEFSFRVRLATDADMQAIAEAHRASILEIASTYYENDEAFRYWSRERDSDSYRVSRDQHGEVFFVAEPVPSQTGYVYGFSSYRFENEQHRLQGFYVRGTAARRGIGTCLLDVVEHHACAQGAEELHLEASLSGEAFYKAAGFIELSRKPRPFVDSGQKMESIMMVKPIARFLKP